jgi:hypothetical protein
MGEGRGGGGGGGGARRCGGVAVALVTREGVVRGAAASVLLLLLLLLLLGLGVLLVRSSRVGLGLLVGGLGREGAVVLEIARMKLAVMLRVGLGAGHGRGVWCGLERVQWWRRLHV